MQAVQIRLACLLLIQTCCNDIAERMLKQLQIVECPDICESGEIELYKACGLLTLLPLPLTSLPAVSEAASAADVPATDCAAPSGAGAGRGL